MKHPKKQEVFRSRSGEPNQKLGSDFGRTDFSRIFIFEPPDFFADFVAGFFLLIFAGKKCPKKSSRKIPGKILQNLHNKNPRHISAEGPGQQKKGWFASHFVEKVCVWIFFSEFGVFCPPWKKSLRRTIHKVGAIRESGGFSWVLQRFRNRTPPFFREVAHKSAFLWFAGTTPELSVFPEPLNHWRGMEETL